MLTFSVYYYVSTNISNKFFNKDDIDDLFCKWLEEKISKYNLFNLSVRTDKTFNNSHITSLKASVEGINYYDKDVNVVVDICTDYDENEFDDPDEAYNIEFTPEVSTFITERLIPALIEEFNNTCKIEFPLHKDYGFEELMFDGSDFYTRIFSCEGKYQSISTDIAKFQLLHTIVACD